jgi:hypothetical protein
VPLDEAPDLPESPVVSAANDTAEKLSATAAAIVNSLCFIVQNSFSSVKGTRVLPRPRSKAMVMPRARLFAFPHTAAEGRAF